MLPEVGWGWNFQEPTLESRGFGIEAPKIAKEKIGKSKRVQKKIIFQTAQFVKPYPLNEDLQPGLQIYRRNSRTVFDRGTILKPYSSNNIFAGTFS